jgi:hypothetical protein
MGWASAAIERLRQSEAIMPRSRGPSMDGKVEDDDLVTAGLLSERAPHVGNGVLVRLRGREYLHLIKASQDDRCPIENNSARARTGVQRRRHGPGVRGAPPVRCASSPTHQEISGGGRSGRRALPSRWSAARSRPASALTAAPRAPSRA